jgi:hypothetical protein
MFLLTILCCETIPIILQANLIFSVTDCILLDPSNVTSVYSCQEKYLSYPGYVSTFYLITQISNVILVTILLILSISGKCCRKPICTYENYYLDKCLDKCCFSTKNAGLSREIGNRTPANSIDKNYVRKIQV